MFIDPDPRATGVDHESRTRRRVLEVVTRDGPVTAAQIGERLELTAAAVRRHLDALAEQGAIREHEPAGAAKRGRGRPARAWVLAPVGHRRLDADYAAVAEEAVRYLAHIGGPTAVAEFARQRVEGLEARYAAELAEVGDDPQARADTLVAALTRDGFAATARPVDAGPLSGIQVCQGHCPIQRVASEFPEFCEAEADAFSRLVGVHVQRLATLAGGDHVCTTFIPQGELRTRPPDRPAAHEKHPRTTTTARDTNGRAGA